jgi:uncharacterized protein (DUF924 family)
MLSIQTPIYKNKETIVNDILYTWETKLQSIFDIKEIENIDIDTREYIKNNFSSVLLYLEYGHLLEWLNKGLKTYYAIIILFTLFSQSIYYNTRDIYKNNKKIFLFMEMGLEFYNITFNQIKDHTSLHYVLLLPFQLIENNIYQYQGKKIILNYLINEKKIRYKNILRKILYYQNKRIQLLKIFNRFPDRNALLNREPTIKEIDYLDELESLHLK